MCDVCISVYRIMCFKDTNNNQSLSPLILDDDGISRMFGFSHNAPHTLASQGFVLCDKRIFN